MWSGLLCAVRRVAGARIFAVAATAGLVVAASAAAAGTAQADTVICPTVAAGTGFLTPPPTAGVDWSGCNLTGAFFGSADISGANFTDANLSEAGLGGVNANDANFTDATLSDAQASTAQLTDADFVGANLTDMGAGANFTGANLRGANISATQFQGATFADLSSGDLTATQAPVLPALWSLSDGYLLGPGVNFDGLNLTGWNLSNLNLSNSEFVGANLTNANLDGDNLAGSDVQDAIFTGVSWTAVESGGITGTPAALPAHWTISDGYLIGPDDGLVSANLAGANLTGADLAGADLYLGSLAGANLTDADFQGASLDLVDLTGAIWSDTSCPDGSNSDNDGGTCAGNIDDQPPTAEPTLDVTGGQDGFYPKVTVVWHWTDGNATINPAACPASTTSTTQGDPATINGICLNSLGGVGTASVQVNIENQPPAVSVTGVGAGHVYALGHVPAAGCRTADSLSGVAQKASVTVTTTGSHGVGRFTATCTGAANKAGIRQTVPVKVQYTVAYGFSGFSAPRTGATLAKSAHAISVTFALAGPGRKGIPARAASKLKVRVTLSGPGISAVRAACSLDSAASEFRCTLKTPAKAKTGRSQKYKITAWEDVGTGFVAAPAVGKAVNPEIVHFK